MKNHSFWNSVPAAQFSSQRFRPPPHFGGAGGNFRPNFRPPGGASGYNQPSIQDAMFRNFGPTVIRGLNPNRMFPTRPAHSVRTGETVPFSTSTEDENNYKGNTQTQTFGHKKTTFEANDV